MKLMNVSEVPDPTFSINVIDNKRYRSLQSESPFADAPIHRFKSQHFKAKFEDIDPEGDDVVADHASAVTGDLDVLSFEGSKCSARLEIPEKMLQQLKSEIYRLGDDYECQIVFEGSSVLVKSNKRESVLGCLTELNGLIASKRASMSPTHFVCIPVGSPAVVERVRDFRRSLPAHLQEHFLPLDTKVHLTLCVLTLLTKEEEDKAVAALEKFSQTYESSETLEYPLTGLHSMSEDASKTPVVYTGKPSEHLEEKIHSLCAILFDCLVQVGAVTEGELTKRKALQDGKASIKTHVTLLNTKYSRKQTNALIDARELISMHKEHKFGTSELSEVRLCLLSGMDESSSTYIFYRTVSSVRI